ncbi:MAG TPA: TRAP transporter substrate-binding protein [Rhodocyclaceae bacterium]|nr:TRAP transporter substrate-binding protein [Rhodocyclaceae bacterium]
MKFFGNATLAGIVAAGVMSFLPASAQAIESATLQLATISPPDNVWYKAAVRFAEGVAERTGGKVTIQIAHSGMTGSVRESVEALQIGTNDIVQTVIASLEPYDDIAAIESYPYLIRDAEHFDKVFGGAVGQELYQEIGKRTGFTLIGAGFRGARETASKRPVNSVDELAGLKIRVPEIRIFRRTWELLGASPVPMGTAEVYTGLQQGIIDAVENPLEAHVRSRYYEAANYVLLTSHVHGAYTFLFSDRRFARFSPELQAILREEGEKAMRWGSEQTIEEIEGYKAELERRGVRFIAVDHDAFRAKLANLPQEFPKLAPWVERIAAVE